MEKIWLLFLRNYSTDIKNKWFWEDFKSAWWVLWISVTLMVRSPEADTIYLSSKSTTFTAARCPTRTRRRLMSVGEAMSQTAMERSLEQVTIRPFAKRRWRTASLWWISVFSTSPVVTSQTLQERSGRVEVRGVRTGGTEHERGEQGGPGKKEGESVST